MLFPRLDRPTVIGDEGRPRAASLIVASLTVLALTLAGGWLLGRIGVISLIGLLTGTVTAGLRLLERDRFGHLFVGTLLTVPVGAALIVWLLVSSGQYGPGVLTSSGPQFMPLLSGLTLALLGIGLTWADVGDRSATGNVVKHTAVGYGGMILGLVIPLSLLGVYPRVQPFLLADGSMSSMVASVLFSMSALGTAVYIGRYWLPIVQLTPRPRKQAVRDTLGTVRTVAAVGAILSFFCIVPASILLSGWSVTSEAQTVVTSTLSSIMFWLATLIAVLAVGTKLFEKVLTSQEESEQRLLAAVSVGIFVGLFVMVSPFGTNALGIVVGFMLIGPVLFIFAILVVLVGMALGILPERGVGLAIASVGLGVATIGASMGGLAAPYVFACAAGTVLVWDVSMFGLGLTAELGHIPDTRRLEVIHAVAVVGIAAGAILIASGLFELRAFVSPRTGAMAAVAVAVAGTVFAVLPLRG